MIVKSYDLNKSKILEKNFFLLYGINVGLKNEIINTFFKNKELGSINTYDESDILKDKENFYSNVLSKSFFENKKIIIINEASDKILETIENILDRNIEDVKIILKSNLLDKKSKLRNFFEKNKETFCIAFYEDNNSTLSKIAYDFFKKKNLSISQQNINFIIERSSGDRNNLKNELNKIESYSKEKREINFEEIIKLTNLAENFSISELVDNSLVQNKKRTLNILNENNFAQEDTIIILRVFLSKLKRLMKLQDEVQKNTNIDSVISAYKPVIFWKEKAIVKSQMKILNYEKILSLIIGANKVEYLIKKNPTMSINLVTNFIIERCLRLNN